MASRSGHGLRPRLHLLLRHPVHGTSLQLFWDPEEWDDDPAESMVHVPWMPGTAASAAPDEVELWRHCPIVEWLAVSEIPDVRSHVLRSWYPDGVPYPLFRAHRRGTKLDGWPTWVQTEDTPVGAELAFQFAVDPCGLEFGDAGVLYGFGSWRPLSVELSTEHG